MLELSQVRLDFSCINADSIEYQVMSYLLTTDLYAYEEWVLEAQFSNSCDHLLVSSMSLLEPI